MPGGRPSIPFTRLTAMVGLILLSGCLSAPPASDGPDPLSQSPAPPVVEARTRIHVLVLSTGFYPANPAFEPNLTSIRSNSSVVLTYRDQDLNPMGKHDWMLEGVEGAKTPLVKAGEEATIEFVAPLKPGEYVYYCSVPQHRGFGMEGTLTIT